jgi:predicted Zn-dependent protease
MRGGWALVRPACALGRYGARHPVRLLIVLVLLVIIAGGTAVAGSQLWAAYHLRAARECMARYHNAEAPHHLQACLWVRPHDPEVLLLKARAARRSSAFDLAEETLQTYEDRHGVDDALTQERMLLRAERGDFESVRKFFWAQVEQQHPDTPLILEAIVRGYLRGLRIRDAEECLDRWQALEPDNVQALVFRGVVCEMRERHGEATTYYRRVVEIDPLHDDARLRLATALVHLGRGGEALPHLEYLRQRLPDNADLGVNLAQSKEFLGRAAEAEKELDDVLARHPDCATALAQRGKLALQAGRLEEAEDFLRRALSLDPGTYSTRYQFYTCLTRRGKTAEAKEEAERLKAVEEDMRTLQDIISHRMQMAPHDPSLHYQVAQILLRSGQVDEAVRWLHSALRADPQYAPAHQKLAVYYVRIGNQGLAAYHRAQGRSAAAGKATASPPTPLRQEEKERREPAAGQPPPGEAP